MGRRLLQGFKGASCVPVALGAECIIGRGGIGLKDTLGGEMTVAWSR